eukprot:gene13110-17574_t
MKFLGLLSGGKDSCYNIMKCCDFGHELVCLINLYPKVQQLDVNDMNLNRDDNHSYMYQTAGHTIIPLMEECFGVPLIRKEILGSCINYGLMYNNTDSNDSQNLDMDEVEDLYAIIKKTLLIYPDIKGVSCGAIVSNYQRFRVENICHRLNLTSLCYLWQRDRIELLNEIVSNNINAILVKVAGAGLIPEKHLGKSLENLRFILMQNHERFGLDVCGEGGEYESIVLDCPYFKKKIIINASRIDCDSEDPSVGCLTILSAELIDKTQNLLVDLTPKIDQIDYDYQLNAKLDCLLNDVIIIDDLLNVIPNEKENIIDNSNNNSNSNNNDNSNSYSNNNNNNNKNSNNSLNNNNSINEIFDYNFMNCKIYINNQGLGQSSLVIPNNNLKSKVVNFQNLNITDPSNQQEWVTIIHAQVKDVMTKINIAMSELGIDMSDIFYVHLYISDMSLFSIINEEYCHWFHSNPPSRSCVEIPLPVGVLVAIDIRFLKGSYQIMDEPMGNKIREVLHVQSMSEWAPLCIGPYSQSNIIHNSLIFVAGQIPLNPATMQLISIPNSSNNNSSKQDFINIIKRKIKLQLLLSLLHVARVLSTLESSLPRSLSCLLYVNIPQIMIEFEIITGQLVDESSFNNDFNHNNLFFNELMNIVRIALWKNCNETIVTNQTNNNNHYNSNVNYNQIDLNDLSDQEEEDNLHNNKHEINIHPPCPINIIGVSNIPRNALVEVELIGFKHQTLSSDKFTYSIEKNKILCENMDNNNEGREMLPAENSMTKSVELELELNNNMMKLLPKTTIEQ